MAVVALVLARAAVAMVLVAAAARSVAASSAASLQLLRRPTWSCQTLDNRVMVHSLQDESKQIDRSRTRIMSGEQETDRQRTTRYQGYLGSNQQKTI